MTSIYRFYICPTCFNIASESKECHEHMMLVCDPGEPGGNSRKPRMVDSHCYQTSAPDWFLEAIKRRREKA